MSLHLTGFGSNQVDEDFDRDERKFYAGATVERAADSVAPTDLACRRLKVSQVQTLPPAPITTIEAFRRDLANDWRAAEMKQDYDDHQIQNHS